MLCHWACSSQNYEGTTFLKIIRQIPIHWSIFGIILIFSVVLNEHNPTSYHTKFHTYNKIVFWDTLNCIFQYACAVILWLVLMNADETTWLPHWLPALSCHCADHMAAPTALPLCRPHGCPHCTATVQTTWLPPHPTSINLFNASKKVCILFNFHVEVIFIFLLWYFVSFWNNKALYIVHVLPHLLVPINQEHWDYTARFHKIATHLGTTSKF